MASGWASWGSRASSLASQLPQGIAPRRDSATKHKTRGSRLAGDGVRMGAVGLKDLIAGKPAPTRDHAAVQRPNTKPVGAGLAREEAVRAATRVSP
ncbi:hypothetical protein CCU68_24880 [Pseudomonas gingeri NCPPB 3146 = LMG 5327]|uniref:Uncharacterized protein n=1 Tax=Pseudomonas gingeri NCPPB 3146 = LMG 5327 TaxID=707248 RepID=A0ABX4XY91_9PSED|nr:hypothetical protein CCU68_24880 [Pseudomonas gingeri NCPPB 3146 = LMG 5327]